MSTPDILVIILYLAGSLGVGIAYRGRQKDIDDYFRAGGRLGGGLGTLLVGFSIAATLFSGITFVAYPSVVYSRGIAILMGTVFLPTAWVVLRFWFLPRFLAAAPRTPYDVIESHFGLRVRQVAAGLFVLLRVGWMAALIYAPTLVILAAGRLPSSYFWPVVLAIGVISTIYTTVGGIRGVIITDAVQFVVIAGGLLLVVLHILTHLPVPIGQALGSLSETEHFGLFDFDPSFTRPFTFWSIIIGFTVANVSSYVSDQMSLQRYLAAGGIRAASRSFLINIVGVLLVLLLLSATGLSLAAWYRFAPDPNLPAAADRVFPHFIATQLPPGLSGLLIAAILAATMSSMTSGINAMAGSVTNDFWSRMGKIRQPHQLLRFARWVSLIVGLAATLCAGAVGRLGSVFEIAQTLLGVFLGPLLGVMLLAVGRVPISPAWVIGGLAVGSACGWAVALSPVFVLWVAPASLAGTLGVAAIGYSRANAF